jgi:hypothetical protein
MPSGHSECRWGESERELENLWMCVIAAVPRVPSIPVGARAR